MGTSYSNAIVMTEPKKVVGYLKYTRRPAYVSRAEGSSCVVCEPLSEDISSNAADISKNVNCVVLLVANDDDDCFLYELWERGILVDSHRSPGQRHSSPGKNFIVRPDEWTPEDDKLFRGPKDSWDDEEQDWDKSVLGNAKLLCDAFGRPDAVAQVAKILSSTEDDDKRYSLSHTYHSDLSSLLGLPESSHSESFESIEANPEAHSDWIKC